MRSNQVSIGIIIILIGIFSIVRKLVSFDAGALTVMFAGFAFLLLYNQKKAIWALFVGGYMTCIGVLRVMPMLGISLSAPQAAAGMCFIVPGAIFMLLYYDKNKQGLLVPACVLLWLGGGIVLIGALGLGLRAAFGLLVTCVGLSLCHVYIIGRNYLSRGLIYIGLCVIIMGSMLTGGLISIAVILPRLASYALIALGVLVIIKGFISKPRD